MRALAIAATLAVLVPPAHADNPAMETIVAGAIRRARRSFAVGPEVGGAVAYLPSPATRDYPISFGLGLRIFRIPLLPDLARVRELTIERTKAAVTERAAEQLLSGHPPDRDALEAMARELGQQIAVQVAAELSSPPKVVETPRLSVDLEGAYLPVAKAWQLRITAGFGISKLTLGPTINLNLTRPRRLFVGGELALHLMPTRGSRSPVIDLYLRGDAGVTSAARKANQLVLGTRLLLDFL